MHPVVALVTAAASLGSSEHDLGALESQGDLVVVDVLDGVTLDIAADLGEHMRGSRTVEQERLVALRHDANNAQRNLPMAGLGACLACIQRLAVLAANERGEQSQREDTGGETHAA